MSGYGFEEESIYNIVDRVIPDPPKPPMYRSKHDGKLPPTSSTFKTESTSKPGVQNISGEDAISTGGHHKYVKLYSNFGPVPGSGRPDPQAFRDRIAKNVSVKSAEQIKKDAPDLLVPAALKKTSKPTIPKQSDKPVMNLVTTKNFIVANAVESILAVPKKVAEPTKYYTDDPNYGKVPQYLEKIKTDIANEYEYIQKMQEEEEAARASRIQEISSENQHELMEGLKARWEVVNHKYQGQTHLTKLDTLGKIRRKEMNEKELAQLEKDMQKISKQKIYVDTTQ